MRHPQLLLAIVVALLVGNAVGLIISVLAKFPAEFGGVGDPDNVLGEWPTRGTLLAAPLGPLVALIVGSFLAVRGGRWLGGLGLIVIIVVNALFIIGIFGEPSNPEASDPPVVFWWAWRAGFLALAGTAIVLAALQLPRIVEGAN